MHPQPLVGRRAETALIDDGLARVVQGHGGTLLLSGEPGIGKTRLVQYATERARARGVQVALGRCWEVGGAPPGWPWVEAMRSRLGTGALRSAAQMLGDDRVHLRSLYPQLADPSSHRVHADRPALDPADPPASDPSESDPSARFLAFDAVASLWIALGRVQPTLLVLEDLHAADRYTAELLAMVCHRGVGTPLMVLGTYRGREARLADEIVEPLARAARIARVVELGRLEPDDARELAAALLADDPTSPAVERVVARADGNPLFAVELARTGDRTAALGPITGVDHVVDAHLDLLEPDTAEVAELAAALGRRLPVALLQRIARVVLGLSAEAVDGALARLTALELVQAEAEGVVAFTHILVRDALDRRASPERRRMAHAASADALEGSGAPSSVLAHHALEAADAIALPRTLALARRAATDAAATLALVDAAAVLRRALAHAETADALDELELAELRLECAEAEIVAGRVAQGRARCVQVAETARRRDAPTLLARAALAYGLEFSIAARDPTMARLLSEALEALGPATTALRVRVLARYAVAMYPQDDDPETPMRLSAAAIAAARDLGDPRTLLEVLYTTRIPLILGDPTLDIATLEGELVALVRRFGSPARQVATLTQSAAVMTMANEVAVAEAFLFEAFERAHPRPTPQAAYRLHLVQAMLRVRRGDFAAAEDSVRLAMEACAQGPVQVPLPRVASHRFGVARLRRECDRLIALRPEVETIIAPLPSSASMLAWYYATLGELDEARRQLLRRPRDLRCRAPLWLCMLADTATMVGDTGLCAQVYEVLLPFGDHLITSGMMGFMVEGSAHATLGRLAAALGRRTDALAHFERAAAIDEANGGRPALANALEDWGRVLLTGEDEAERVQGRALWARAAALLDELGLEGRAAALAASAGVQLPGLDASDRYEDVATPVASAGAQGIARLALRPDGDGYAVTFGAAHFRLRGSKGLRYLELLVQAAGTDVHALELMTADAGPETKAALGGSVGPLLDARAKAAYRARLVDLQAAIAEAEDHADYTRAEALQAQMEAVLGELGRAVGLGGRDRDRSPAERARINVQRRLKAATEALGRVCPPLADHLARALRTGALCRYDPPSLP